LKALILLAFEQIVNNFLPLIYLFWGKRYFWGNGFLIGLYVYILVLKVSKVSKVSILEFERMIEY